MKTTSMTIIVVAALAAASPAVAQSAFDGTWKADTASAQFGGKPTVRVLKNGTYSCPSCSIPWSVPADGGFHAIKGNPYVDDVAVTVVDPATVRFVYRKGGKVNDDETVTLSDGNAIATFKGTDTSAANGLPVSYEAREKRVAPAGAGSHALSGSWQAMSGATVSDAALTMTLKTAGDTVTMSYPTGESVTARLGGPAAAISGDPGQSTMKFVRTGASSMTATTMRMGKVTSVSTMTVAPDGRTMTYANDNRQNGSSARFTLAKQ